jgi:hypothetical protein
MSEAILAFKEWYKATGCQVCKDLPLNISEIVQLHESPQRSSHLDLYPEPKHVMNILSL